MKVKAVALLSGGLDSILAVQLIIEQGVEVEALHFNNPFSASGYKKKQNLLEKVSRQLEVKLKNLNLDKEYLWLIRNPKYGYGKNLNPCIDCRIWMLKAAKKYMEERGASFLITGEVLGQRPMSQQRRTVLTIEKEAGLKGLIVRPLSGQKFSRTLPEEKGWIKRDSLLAISGRSRKDQLYLADKYKIRDYFWAAGGCLLTDSGFSRRLADIIRRDDLTLEDIELLKTGRHFRINSFFKLVVARDESEGIKIEKLAKRTDFVFKPIEDSGPTGLGRGKLEQVTKEISAKIIARYSSAQKSLKVEITGNEGKINEVVTVVKPKSNKYKKLMI